MNLEEELRSALRRKEPPAGFAARVAAQAVAQSDDAPQSRRTPWRAIAAALTMTAFLGGWAAREAATQRAAGERARDEVLTALRITSEKLRTAQEHVKHIGTENE